MNADEKTIRENPSPQNAIFVDRDGVIIHNQAAYVRSLEQVKIYPRALKALSLAARSGFKIVVVTNQAGVGKGLYSIETVKEINQSILAAVEQAGGRIDAFYICPHRSDEDCPCRKPKPGLLRQAALDLNINLGGSYMVGDALSDMSAGQRAGVKESILVLTGRGSSQLKLAAAAESAPAFSACKSLLEAVKYILTAR